MWKNFVKDYLSFTKKDRVGIIVLVTLIFLVWLLPSVWPSKKPGRPSAAQIAAVKLQAAKLNNTDTSADQREVNSIAHNFLSRKNDDYPEGVLFYFDPNTLDAAGWKKLGLRDKTINTIQNYLSKGGHFRQPQDLGKIYGLFKKDYERLLPFIRIQGNGAREIPGGSKMGEDAAVAKFVYPAKRDAVSKQLDINSADTSAWIALPGIGNKLAARIVNFRTKLGGFYDVGQVAETYGLPDSTFDKIKTNLICHQPGLQQININTADANTLKQHPYIRWNLANLIVQYRNQHGSFQSLDDLLQIATVTPDLLKKIKPYLQVK